MTADDIEREAIERYHALLGDEIAADTQGELDAQLRSRNLYFGERPLVTVLRPRWMTPARYRECQHAAARVLHAFRTAHRAALADPAVRRQFRLEPWEERLALTDPGFDAASPTSRLDAFFVREIDGVVRLRFTEYNAETPAGAAYNDALADVFDALPAMRAFVREYDLRPLLARAGVLRALLDSFEQWAGRRERPRIGILDWTDVPTYSEFLLYERYFREHGLDCVIADPREVEYRDGRLLAGDFHITLVYKRVLLAELIARCGEEGAVVRAVRDGAVCMVNPFACKLLHKKASLAVLSDERNAALFDARETAAIRAHIPWTRVVEERRTFFGEQRVDLLEFIRDHRDRLVLKPNDDYGGKGILLGWEATDAEWSAGIDTALAEPYIVQERIALPSEPYPSLVDGAVRVVDRMLDTAPFVVGGEDVDGCMTRLSTAALLNVTAGGGSSVPTYLIERRAR